jgi:hypothetical protein
VQSFIEVCRNTISRGQIFDRIGVEFTDRKDRNPARKSFPASCQKRVEIAGHSIIEP